MQHPACMARFGSTGWSTIEWLNSRPQFVECESCRILGGNIFAKFEHRRLAMLTAHITHEYVTKLLPSDVTAARHSHFK